MRTTYAAAILVGLTLGVLGCDNYMFGSHLSAKGPAVVPIEASFEVRFVDICQDGGRYEPDNCADGVPKNLQVEVDTPGLLQVEELGDDRVTFRAVSLGTVTVTGTALLDGEPHSATHTVEVKPLKAINGIGMGCGYMDVNGTEEIDMRFSGDNYAFFPVSGDVTKYFETNGIVRIERGSTPSSIVVKGTGIAGVATITAPSVGYEEEFDVVRLESMVLEFVQVEDQEDTYRLNGSIDGTELHCWGHTFTSESLTPDVCEVPGTWAPSQELKIVRHLQSTCLVRLVDAQNSIDRTFELQP